MQWLVSPLVPKDIEGGRQDSVTIARIITSCGSFGQRSSFQRYVYSQVDAVVNMLSIKQ